MGSRPLRIGLAVGSLMAIVGISGWSHLVSAQPSPISTPAPSSPGITPAPRPVQVERHPELREALQQLRVAQRTLQSGHHDDVGGERIEALKDVNKAINELETALARGRRQH
jgi:hypothetical protein